MEWDWGPTFLEAPGTLLAGNPARQTTAETIQDAYQIGDRGSCQRVEAGCYDRLMIRVLPSGRITRIASTTNLGDAESASRGRVTA
jgi:hypothetical protein